MTLMNLPITTIANYGCVCGEGPIWHDTEKLWYWFDIPTGRLFRCAPRTGEHACVYTGRFIGAATVQRDDSLLLLGQDCEVLVYRDGKTQTVIEGIAGETRFNDAIADPRGRVFSGTMPVDAKGGGGDYNEGRWSRLGRLYRIDPDGSYRVVDEGFGCANGMGFTPDGRGMYFTDSHAGTIYRYDYDETTGGLFNRSVFFEEAGIIPDGMAMDAQGHVWSARWGGGCVVKHDQKTGNVVERFELPTTNITCIAFGGEDRDTAYITSAGGTPPGSAGSKDGGSGDGGNQGPAGGLFATVIPGVRGVAEHRSAVGL